MSRPHLARKQTPAAPVTAVDHLKLAIALHARNDLDGAEAAYRASLALDPGQFYASQLLGVLLNQTRRPKEGLERLDAALALAPHLPDAHVARGDTLASLRRYNEALAAYDAAIELRPHHVDSWKCRGATLMGLNRVGEAIDSYDRALAIKPDHVDTIMLRGAALAETRRYDLAFAEIDRALAIAPDWGPALVWRGILLYNSGQPEQALVCLETAVEKSPQEVGGWINRGLVLARLRRFDEAMASFEEGLERHPGSPDALFWRGITRLLYGDFAAAWPDYESRFASKEETAHYLVLSLPVWRGEPLAGKRILVYEEQGFGDVLMFCRFLCELEARGAQVTMAARATLAPLLQSLSSSLKVVVTVSAEEAEGFDYQCPLMSLPLGLGTVLSTIPANIPYLKADPERVAWWRARLGGGFKVGICWSASIHGFRQGRSAALADFAPLSDIPGVRLISLQREVGVELLRAPPTGMKVETLGKLYEDGDFLETAALVTALDLVISVDTAILHVAGAVGRPIWVALPYVSDWRWLLDRSDSPWYPTMRLFRSRAPNDWASVFSQIEQSLRDLTRRGRQAVSYAPGDVVGP